MKQFSLFFMFLYVCATSGCKAEFVDELLIEPDIEIANELGKIGPYGARLWVGNLDGVGDIELVTPEESSEQARALFVFGQGGSINASRYRWLTSHVASRGFVAVVPVGPFDWGAFSSGKALRKAVEGLQSASLEEGHLFQDLISEDTPVIFGGHSRGGVNAADAFAGRVKDGEPASLVLLESYPNPAKEFSDLDGRVIAIAGEKDGRVTIEKVEIGAESFDSSIFVTVAGMNHYQLTDEPTEKELEKDGVSTVDTETVRFCTMIFIDALLEEVVTEDTTWLDQSEFLLDCIKK